MDEEQLTLVEEGLNLLIQKYKKNQNDGDLQRMQAVVDAKIAIRKVMLSVAIKGDIKDIVPVLEGGKGAGWEVTDFENKVMRYHA
ncbi:MAG: hypothetical protein H7336_15685 [Bacteriovorax sp.]|nr:hypothetical protein [Bacteriovorax sp.]